MNNEEKLFLKYMLKVKKQTTLKIMEDFNAYGASQNEFFKMTKKYYDKNYIYINREFVLINESMREEIRWAIDEPTFDLKYNSLVDDLD